MFIVVQNQDGDNEAWSINTDADRRDAQARLRELGISYAEIWAGEDDEYNDTVQTGRRLFAE